MPNDNRPAGDSHAPHDSRDVDDLCYDSPAAENAAAAAALNHEPAAPDAVERRQAPRLKYEVAATLEPVAPDGSPDVRVVTRDADTRGTGFVSSSALPEGSRAVLHLPDPDADGGT